MGGFWGKWDKKDVILKNKAEKLLKTRTCGKKQTQNEPKNEPETSLRTSPGLASLLNLPNAVQSADVSLQSTPWPHRGSGPPLREIKAFASPIQQASSGAIPGG